MTLWRKNYVRLNKFQKLRLWWILIPWALKKIAGRKATSGSMLVPVPQQGLWWHLSLCIQLLACLLPTGKKLFVSQSSEFPWGILLTESLAQGGQSSTGSPNWVSCSGFSWSPKPEGLLTGASPGHLLPPPNMPGKTGKQSSLSWAVLLPWTLICAEPKARAPKSERHRCQSLLQGFGDHKAYEVIWSQDNRTLQRWRASDSTVPHGGHLHAVTLTLPLINFIFQLTAQAGKSNSFTQFTIKQRSKTAHREQALLDINSIWRSKRGVFNFALSSFFNFHWVLFFLLSDSTESRTNRKNWLLLWEQKMLSHKQMGYSGDSQLSSFGLQMRSFHMKM